MIEISSKPWQPTRVKQIGRRAISLKRPSSFLSFYDNLDHELFSRLPW